MNPRIVEVRKNIMKKNDLAAAALRDKTDLAAAVEFDRPALIENIARVRPGIEVLEVSAKTGEGFER
jgi:Ni2+-binding GTPase involved in maturation of urease and hydrogenase